MGARTGSKLGLALLVIVLVGGCTSARMAAVNARLGLQSDREPVRAAAVPPELAGVLNSLYREGAEAIRNNQLDTALAAWREYARLAPTQLAQARAVRGYLTLLEREAAKRFAKQAMATEKASGFLQTDRYHVALLPFRSKTDAGDGRAKPFNRAIQAMVATDLAQVPALTILERDKMDYLLRELSLGESGLVDPASAARAGRMLGAGTLVAGVVYNEANAYGGYDPYQTGYTGRYTISTAVSDVDQGRVLGVQDAVGWQYNYFELEKQVVHGILDTLGIKDYPAAVDRIHTRNWEAYAKFTLGLKLLDEDRFEEARQAFYDALVLDPDFALAESSYLATPAGGQSLEQLKSGAAR